MSFVVDNSVAMAWCLADEANSYTEAALDRLGRTGAVVPAMWPLEAANVLLLAERRGRVAEAQILRLAQLLQQLPLTVDDAAIEQALSPLLALAREQGLSSHDAAYLELAARLGLPLATQDARMRMAAARIGVPLVP